MKIFKVMIVSALFVGSLFGASSAHADPISCDGCSGPFDKRIAAENYGPGDHLVYDLAANSVERWIVEQTGPETEVPRRIGSGASVSALGGLRITPGVVPEEAIRELDIAHRLNVEAGFTLNPVYVVPMGQYGIPGGGYTAYDVVTNKNLQAQIVDQVAKEEVINQVVTGSVKSYFSELYALVTTFFGFKGEASMQFKLMAADGSYYMVIVSASEPGGRYVKGSARSAGGELIPEEKSDIKHSTWTGGSTGYQGGALDAMVGHLERLGATMNVVGSGASPGGGTGPVIGITCADDVCHVYILSQIQ
ncbi:hypothetical protein [Stenotrophomonas sp.]|uniref:hypothetical protein n=1 Tax=unclassified Stenotrophomonas TaxID=196198 RepID=UPI0028A6751E|nr:hypothetical protein [Stenotrophomonas sp.]